MLSLQETSADHRGTVLGSAWNVLNPILQILVYWFVFSVGLKVQPSRGNVPYVVWLTTGLMPWMSINKAITSGTGAVLSYAGVLKTMNFPLPLIPAMKVTSEWINHFWTMCILTPAVILFGIKPSVHMIGVLYYMVCGFAFLLAFTLLTSAVQAVFQDFQGFLVPVLRLLFYVSSVVWPLEQLSPRMAQVLRLNPLTYVIEGYRNCLLYQTGIFAHPKRLAWFWLVTVGLFVCGCVVHVRLRKHFIDEL